MRAVLAAFFLLLGLAFPLLLNGQEFTNELLGIAFATAALLVGAEIAPLRRDRTHWKPDASAIIAVLSGLLILVLLMQLPSAFRTQRDFHRSMKRARQMMREKERSRPPDPAISRTARPTEAGGPGRN